MGNFQMIKYDQWAPDRASKVDMSAVLVIDGIPSFGEGVYGTALTEAEIGIAEGRGQ